MLYHPELTVYVLLIPVVLVFILPCLAMMARMVFSLVARGMARFDISAGVLGKERGVLGEGNREKRMHPRHSVSGVVADVTDGTNSCTGLVCNISRFGVGLIELPEKFMQEADRFSIIIKGQGSHFPMYLNPQWGNITGSSLRIGGLIENVPADWEDFLAGR